MQLHETLTKYWPPKRTRITEIKSRNQVNHVHTCITTRTRERINQYCARRDFILSAGWAIPILSLKGRQALTLQLVSNEPTPLLCPNSHGDYSGLESVIQCGNYWVLWIPYIMSNHVVHYFASFPFLSRENEFVSV